MLEPLRSLDTPVDTTPAFEQYQINSEDNKADIVSFAGDLSKSLGFRDKDKEAICNKLSERSEGMFLWARLGGERLHTGMRSKRLETVLTEIPPGLDHAYERDLQTILKKEKYYQDQAIAIFRLVLFSLRPLSVKEFLHALKIGDYQEDIDGTTSGFKEEAIPAIGTDVENKLTALLGGCGSLLGVRKTESDSPGNWNVQFIHFSAKEYLLGLRSEDCRDSGLLKFSFSHPEENHAILTNTCLLYLIISGLDRGREMSDERFIKQSPPGRDTACEPRERKWRFYNYARFNWGKHLNLCGTKVSQSYAMQRKIFIDSSLAFDSWKLSLSPHVVCAPCTPSSVVHIVEAAIDRVVSSVFSSWHSRVLASCMFGVTDFLRELLAEVKGRIPAYALSIAVYCQQAAVAEMLIQRYDVDVNERPDGADTTLLHRANQLGLKDIVRMLLGRPELRVNDVFKELLEPGTERALWERFRGPRPVLWHAIGENDQDFVRLLLERDDLDVNCDNDGYTPLIYAVTIGKVELVKLLLGRKDIDVNCTTADGFTPLHCVACMYISCAEYRLQLLLARDDILVNKIDGPGQTPLDRALRSNNMSMWEFKMLRAKGGKQSWELREEAKVNSSVARSLQPPPPILKYNRAPMLPDQKTTAVR